MSKRSAVHFSIVLLDKKISRKNFTCGNTSLDSYFKSLALQDIKKRVTTVFVALDEHTSSIYGFYTLSMSSVVLDLIPEKLAKKLPRYPSVPAVRLGRLAVAQEVQGQGLGEHLLMDAFDRCLSSEIAWYCFVVDAKNHKARKFYLQYGFREFPDNPLHLFITRKTLELAFD